MAKLITLVLPHVQNNLVVLYRGCTVCVVEGWSIIEVIKANVADIKSGAEPEEWTGWRKEREGPVCSSIRSGISRIRQ